MTIARQGRRALSIGGVDVTYAVYSDFSLAVSQPRTLTDPDTLGSDDGVTTGNLTNINGATANEISGDAYNFKTDVTFGRSAFYSAQITRSDGVVAKVTMTATPPSGTGTYFSHPLQWFSAVGNPLVAGNRKGGFLLFSEGSDVYSLISLDESLAQTAIASGLSSSDAVGLAVVYKSTGFISYYKINSGDWTVAVNGGALTTNLYAAGTSRTVLPSYSGIRITSSQHTDLTSGSASQSTINSILDSI